MRKHFLVLVLLVGVASTISAEETRNDDGNFILQICSVAVHSFDSGAAPNGGGDMFDVAACLGYVRGVVETSQMWQAADIRGKVTNPYAMRMCLPFGVDSKQVVRIAVKGLREHPERLHQPAPSAILSVLSDTFPCK